MVVDRNIALRIIKLQSERMRKRNERGRQSPMVEEVGRSGEERWREGAPLLIMGKLTRHDRQAGRSSWWSLRMARNARIDAQGWLVQERSVSWGSVGFLSRDLGDSGEIDAWGRTIAGTGARYLDAEQFWNHSGTIQVPCGNARTTMLYISDSVLRST